MWENRHHSGVWSRDVFGALWKRNGSRSADDRKWLVRKTWCCFIILSNIESMYAPSANICGFDIICSDIFLSLIFWPLISKNLFSWSFDYIDKWLQTTSFQNFPCRRLCRVFCFSTKNRLTHCNFTILCFWRILYNPRRELC